MLLSYLAAHSKRDSEEQFEKEVDNMLRYEQENYLKSAKNGAENGKGGIGEINKLIELSESGKLELPTTLNELKTLRKQIIVAVATRIIKETRDKQSNREPFLYTCIVWIKEMAKDEGIPLDECETSNEELDSLQRYARLSTAAYDLTGLRNDPVFGTASHIKAILKNLKVIDAKLKDIGTSKEELEGFIQAKKEEIVSRGLEVTLTEYDFAFEDYI